jgi:hypothetical protein
MGEERVRPGPDQFLSPMARMERSIASVNGAKNIPGLPDGQRRSMVLSLIRRTIMHAREVISSPLDTEKPTADKAVAFLYEDNPSFARIYREEIWEAKRIIEEEEKDTSS